MKINQCKKGDLVRIWCIGTGSWDDQVVKIVDNGVSTLVKVEYKSGRYGEFSPSAECKVVG